MLLNNSRPTRKKNRKCWRRRWKKKRANDALAEKLMAAQLESVKEKQMFRALKFFNEPHDNITNQAMLDFTLGKKREIAEKYGWPIDFE